MYIFARIYFLPQMKAQNTVDKQVTTPQTQLSSGFSLNKINYIIIIAGFVLLVIGFLLVAGGRSHDPNVFNPDIFSFRRITLAPIILILGFVTEIVAIMTHFDKPTQTNKNNAK